jgi:hypothetical protein
MTRGVSPGSEESELRSATSFFARRHRRHWRHRMFLGVAAQLWIGFYRRRHISHCQVREQAQDP